MLIIIVSVVAYNLFTVLIKKGLLVIRLQGLTEKIHPSGRAIFIAEKIVDYFEATVPGLAVSRCPLTLRRKKLYTQRRRGQ